MKKKRNKEKADNWLNRNQECSMSLEISLRQRCDNNKHKKSIQGLQDKLLSEFHTKMIFRREKPRPKDVG